MLPIDCSSTRPMSTNVSNILIHFHGSTHSATLKGAGKPAKCGHAGASRASPETRRLPCFLTLHSHTLCVVVFCVRVGLSFGLCRSAFSILFYQFIQIFYDYYSLDILIPPSEIPAYRYPIFPPHFSQHMHMCHHPSLNGVTG